MADHPKMEVGDYDFSAWDAAEIDDPVDKEILRLLGNALRGMAKQIDEGEQFSLDVEVDPNAFNSLVQENLKAFVDDLTIEVRPSSKRNDLRIVLASKGSCETIGTWYFAEALKAFMDLELENGDPEDRAMVAKKFRAAADKLLTAAAMLERKKPEQT